MAIVSFSDEKGWLVARWLFERFFDDVLRVHPGNDVFRHKVKQAVALDGLHLDRIEDSLRDELWNAIVSTANATLAGRPDLQWNKGLDADGQVMYRRAVGNLLQMMEEFGKPGTAAN